MSIEIQKTYLCSRHSPHSQTGTTYVALRAPQVANMVKREKSRSEKALGEYSDRKARPREIFGGDKAVIDKRER